MNFLLTALKAAAEPTRIRLLGLCAHSELTVSELTSILGQSQPRISRHLKLLCEAGLCERQSEGSWAYFRLSTIGAGVEIARMLVDAIPDTDPVHRLDLDRLQEIQNSRADRAAAYFESIAEDWDKVRSLYIDEAEVERTLLELLPANHYNDLLDIGTGTGRILQVLAPQMRHAIGVDASREMLQVARSNLEQSGLRHCKVRQGDMYQLPLPGKSVDAVTVHHVLHFAEKPEQVIRESARVLRPGGRLIIADFESHSRDELRQNHAHIWPGFNTNQIHEWMTRAGLVANDPIFLPGEHLNVVLWIADQPAIAA